jgi:hypothetical protein
MEQSSMSKQTLATQFPFVANAIPLALVIAPGVLSVSLGVPGLLVGGATGAALLGIGFFFLIMAIVLWCMRSIGQGTIILSGSGIVVERAGRRDLYVWDDI